MTGGDHLRLVAQNDPISVAWGAYDRAALALHAMQRDAREVADTPFDAQLRFEAGMHVLDLWREFADLYLAATGGDPGEAA